MVRNGDPLKHTDERRISMSKRELPTSEELHKLLRYRPETGFLYWRPRPREMFRTENAWRA